MKLEKFFRSNINESEDNQYPIAGSSVSGLKVVDDVPNMDSIDATLDDYRILPGIREINLLEFELSGKSYSVTETRRIKNLANEIQENNYITPLIVVQDSEGLYILEGLHRAEALFLLDKRTLPAIIVIDESEEDE